LFYVLFTLMLSGDYYMEKTTDALPKGVVFVNKSEHLEPFAVDEIKKKLHQFIGLYNEKFPSKPIHEFRLTIKEHSPTGKSHQYYMHALLKTDLGEFNAEKEDWDPVLVIGHIVDALKKQALESGRHKHG
jgi:hypothetical protein